MRYHNYESFLGDFLDKIHYLHRGDRVKSTGGFVCKQDFGVVYKCSGDSDSLALTARELIWLLVVLTGKTYSVECSLCPSHSLFLADAGDSEGQLDVSENRLMRNEVIALEDEADSVVSVHVPISVAVILSASSVDNQIARGIVVKTAYDVEQRGFSAAGRAEYRHEFILPERKVNAL